MVQRLGAGNGVAGKAEMAGHGIQRPAPRLRASTDGEASRFLLSQNPSICRIRPRFSTPPSVRCLGIPSAFRGGPGHVRQGFRLDSELCDNA